MEHLTGISLSVCGVAHVTPAPLPLPNPAQQEGWSLTERKRAFRHRFYAEQPVPIQLPVESDAVVWKQVIGSAPVGARDYILRAIAEGGASRDTVRRAEDGSFVPVRGKKGLTLLRSDANRLIFGSGLSKSEQHRNYLSDNGLAFDYWIHNIAVPEYYGSECRFWDGSELMAVEQEWQSELENIISECLSSKHARTLLIESFRAAQKQHVEELPF